MEVLRRACLLTGTNLNDISITANSSSSPAARYFSSGDGASAESESDEDLELVRNIQKRFAISSDAAKPLCSLPPVVSDDDEDDFETLRAVQRRFAAYNSGTLKGNAEDFLQIPTQVRASSEVSEKGSTNYLSVNKTNACEGYPDWKGACNTTHLLRDNVEIQPANFSDWHQSDYHKLSMFPTKNSNFPKSALGFINAIKKNRTCQKFLRDKLVQIEARIEENKKLKERVKILKDFQVSCRKRTGRALSQKKDPRVQLISVQKSWASNDSKVNDKKVSAMHYGPAENSHVVNFRMALTKFPISYHRKKWSEAEKENLGKGIRQQFQGLALLISVDRFSCSEGSPGDSDSIDGILASIKDLEISPEQIREFLPKVNWQQLASMYFVGRSGAECEARWLNCEDPLVNHNPWTNKEDKKLLFIIEKNGLCNWVGIAVSLGTNRTPFQCLARYQRSLNARVLNREWTKEEDDRLRDAVAIFGENDWQAVAFHVKGRTGTQCSNRWKKSLHPARERVGRWSLDEDKRLKVAVMLFGGKNWNKIAQFVPGRDQVQCRERWVNSLDPTLNWNKWTEEEDSRLKAAITEHGYCWSKVATCVPPRTDNQCRRRWKVLLPHEVPLLQAARKMQKAALICNFVDREAERPALGPNDFLPLPMISSISEAETANPSIKRRKRSRGKPESEKEIDSATRNIPKKKRAAKQPPRRDATKSGEYQHSTWSSGKSMLSGIADGTEEMPDYSDCLDLTSLTIIGGENIDTSDGNDSTKQRDPKLHSKRKLCMEVTKGHHSLLSHSERLELRLGDGEGIDNIYMGRSTSSKETSNPNQNGIHKHHGSRNKSTKQSGECQDCACSEQDVPKKSKPRNKSCSKQTSETICGDDITLSCFLRNKSEKKLDAVKNANQACTPSTMIKRSKSPSKGVDQLLDRNQVVSHMQDGEAQACCNDVNFENMSSCNMQVNHSKDIQTIDFSDTTLSCFLHKKSEKKLDTVKNANHACTPSTMIKRSESPSKGVDQLLDRNPVVYPMQDGEARACYDDVNFEYMSSCNMQVNHSKDIQTIDFSDKARMMVLHESGREPLSINLELDSEPGDITEPLGERQDFGCFPCQQDVPKKSRPGDKSCSESTGDDVTLACILSNISKKRKLGIDMSVKQACCSGTKKGSGLPSKGLDQHPDKNQMLSLLQDNEARACYNDVNFENMSSCNMQVNHSKDIETIDFSDKARMVVLHESGREPLSINLELDSAPVDIIEPLGERQDFGCFPCQQDVPKKSNPGDKSCSETTGDDVTLACFLRNVSKKRKLGIDRSVKQACCSSGTK